MPKASWNGAVIAESDDTVVVDGAHYFPADSLNRDYLEKSTHTSVCGWKGTATYYSLQVDGQTNSDAAWCYEDPKPEAENLRGRVAFWKGVEIA